MSQNNICPILLAAGQSQRFGSDKLLYPLSYQGETKPLILHSIKPWLAVFAQINVVVRQDNKALFQLLEKCEFSSHIQLITATHAHQGMSASFISGIKANQQASAWLIGLSDMPFIDSIVIKQSSDALKAGATITQTEFEGRRGHPVGFCSTFLPQLLTLSGDKGARKIIADNSELLTIIQSPNDGIYQDIDVNEDV